jgi:ribosome recycling factor
MIEDILSESKERMEKAVKVLVDEFKTIRTGHASASIFDSLRVDAYGSKMPLNQLATVHVQDAKSIVIKPFDMSTLGDIEKAIQKSELSLNPMNDGNIIRINIPPLTAERRKEYVKLVKNKAEESRIAIRNIRRDANDQFKEFEKEGEISEDDSKRGQEQIQKLTDDLIERINEILDQKEKEILEV